jgi:hypothetical protein
MRTKIMGKNITTCLYVSAPLQRKICDVGEKGEFL